MKIATRNTIDWLSTQKMVPMSRNDAIDARLSVQASGEA
jgi:hypothetical protein